MRKQANDQSLEIIRPELVKEWNYKRNDPLKPENVSCGSGRKIWWKCDKGHEWEASIAHRCNGTGCPYCSGKKVLPENSIVMRFPSIADEWHPTLNTTSAYTIPPKSNKSVWWICADGHAWKEKVVSRTAKKTGCPVCDLNTNSLQNKYPEISLEWHQTKNIPLKPCDVRYGSGKKVWWQCPKSPNHVYQASISNRTLGKGCPYCAGQKVSLEMSLASVNKEIASQWHPTLNQKLSPEQFLPYSKKKIWWQCPNFPEHVWEATIASRSQGSGCPKCNNQTSLPELRIFCELKHYYPDAETRFKIQGKEADIYIPSISLAIEYDGSYFHKDKRDSDIRKTKHFAKHGISLIRVRALPLEPLSEHDVSVPEGEIAKSQLNEIMSKILEITPDASKKIIGYFNRKDFVADAEYNKYVAYLPNPFPEQSLAIKEPKLSLEWHDELNKPLTPKNFSIGSSKVVWWQCPENSQHVYKAAISTRTRGRGCPYCASKLTTYDMSLAGRYPEIAGEWDYKNNFPTNPDEIPAKSNKEFHWVCSVGHSFKASVSARTNHKKNCPVCKKEDVTSKSIGVNYPNLVADWHPSKNRDIDPLDVLPKSQKKRWWLCQKGHEWEATVASRTEGTGCPVCSGRVATTIRNLEIDFPEIAKEFDSEANGKQAYEFKSGSGKKVWWRCTTNPEHTWEAVIYSRTKLKTGCPVCWRNRKKK